MTTQIEDKQTVDYGIDKLIGKFGNSDIKTKEQIQYEKELYNDKLNTLRLQKMAIKDKETIENSDAMKYNKKLKWNILYYGLTAGILAFLAYLGFSK